MRAIPWRGPGGSPDRVPQVRSHAWQRRLARGLTAVRTTFRIWRERRRSRAALATFDDRMLRDIGITRMEAQYEINKPFWRE